MSYQAKIIAGGKISLPAELRRALDLKDGDIITLDHDGTSFTGMTYRQRIKQLQAKFAPYVQPGVSVVDELITERRAEVAKEALEQQEWLEKRRS
ncbi:MAG: AbrB/MazE/SpoVT family DNA-binding domain-containing protein [Sandarakinorhabdus sp.]|nr:AbrB/MazE/SpoVT family DNA-binding domain-containing protein [Sandarakinorhabdus sp.]